MASSFFVVMYVAISVPVIGVGILAQATGLRSAGLTFAAIVAIVAILVLVLLQRERPSPRAADRRAAAGVRAPGA